MAGSPIALKNETFHRLTQYTGNDCIRLDLAPNLLCGHLFFWENSPRLRRQSEFP